MGRRRRLPAPAAGRETGARSYPPPFLDMDRHRRDDDEALNDPLIEGRDVHEIQNVVEQRYQIDAEQRPERSAAAARKRCAADDHRRDRSEVESIAAPRSRAPRGSPPTT